MDNQKFEVILDSLIKRTEEGKLEWKTTGNQYVYLLVLKDSSISLEKFVEGIISLKFRDEKGNIVETVDIYTSEYEAAQENFIKADKLFDLARRKALNADKTIDRILEQLNPDSIAA